MHGASQSLCFGMLPAAAAEYYSAYSWISNQVSARASGAVTARTNLGDIQQARAAATTSLGANTAALATLEASIATLQAGAAARKTRREEIETQQDVLHTEFKNLLKTDDELQRAQQRVPSMR